MPTVYVEPRPTGRSEDSAIKDYVLELELAAGEQFRSVWLSSEFGRGTATRVHLANTIRRRIPC